MDNFDLRKFLAEGKLNEFMSAQDTEDIAGMVADEFTKESADKGEYLKYSVGRVEGEFFELDTEASDMSPEDLDMRGTGEGMGGNFGVEQTENGLEVKNTEKGGLVATIDGSGNFKMLSADESRAGMYIDDEEWEREMGRMEESKEETKSNKMKKSELKEMIRAAMLAESSVEETLVDADQDMAEAILNALGGEAAFEAVVRAMSTDDAQTYLGAIIRDHDIDLEAGVMMEAEEEEVADEIEVEDEDVDVDVDVEDEGEIDVEDDAKVELTGDKAEVSDNLEAALEAARKLGDEKLVDQIGNTITFFTRAHIVKEADMLQDEAEMELEEAKDEEIKENLNESIEFPIWNKIK